jgi:hypothetical protein
VAVVKKKKPLSKEAKLRAEIKLLRLQLSHSEQDAISNYKDYCNAKASLDEEREQHQRELKAEQNKYAAWARANQAEIERLNEVLRWAINPQTAAQGLKIKAEQQPDPNMLYPSSREMFF